MRTKARSHIEKPAVASKPKFILSEHVCQSVLELAIELGNLDVIVHIFFLLSDTSPQLSVNATAEQRGLVTSRTPPEDALGGSDSPAPPRWAAADQDGTW